MTDSVPPRKELLSHRLLGRILQPGGIAQEFLLIRRAFEAAGKPVPGPKDFALVGRGSGSYLLKLVTPRAPSGQSALRFLGAGRNHASGLIPSIDAKSAPVGKIVFRPLEIAGHSPRHLVDHILNPDEISALVLAGFAEAFGAEALDALRRALVEPLSVSSLPAAEFPVIFLPRPGGGDIQATPLSPAEAYIGMGDIRASRFQQQGGQPPRLRGYWHRQEVSAKPQNISFAIGKRRIRFMAWMPRVLAHWEAALHRYARGGPFPRWRDENVIPEVQRYAALLEQRGEYSNHDIRQGCDRRADNLIAAARAFVAEVANEMLAYDPAAKPQKPPKVADLIWNRTWPGDGLRNTARIALTSDHFKERLALAEAG